MKHDVTSYVGERIKYFRKLNKMTQKMLGEKLGVKHNTISSYENGTNELNLDLLFDIANIFDISVNELFPDPKVEYIPTSQANYSEYKYIPVSVAAGVLEDVEGLSKDEVQSINLPDDIMGDYAGRSDVWLMKVNGESMNKLIPHGSTIAVKNVRFEDLKDEDIVVFSYDNGYSVKRFRNDKQNERFIFRPESTETCFTDLVINYELSKKLKIYGKVVLSVVRLD